MTRTDPQVLHEPWGVHTQSTRSSSFGRVTVFRSANDSGWDAACHEGDGRFRQLAQGLENLITNG